MPSNIDIQPEANPQLDASGATEDTTGSVAALPSNSGCSQEGSCSHTGDHPTQPPPTAEVSTDVRREAIKDGTEINFKTEHRGKNSPPASANLPNIIIFGETGVGKSSIINLIAGDRVARTSNTAFGCTFQHEKYPLHIGEVSCYIWDTEGLDEGTAGTVPAAEAENNLKTLIHRLASAGGINLVIYCIVGGRVRKALRRNYDTFYSRVCRKKVPVALVVTHLEHGEMEAWWHTNEKELLRQGMRFDAHACITTLDSDPNVQDRRTSSQQLLRGLIVRYSKQPPCNIDESSIIPMLRNLFRSASSLYSSDRKTTRTVIVHDPSTEYSVESPPGIRAWWHRSTSFIGDQQYEFIRVGVLDQSTKLQDFAGLLIFYTSPLTKDGVSAADEEALKKFYSIAGGWICPMIVVLRCDDEAVAQTHWVTFKRRLGNIQARCTILPTAAHHPSDNKLMGMVETEWVDPPSSKSSAFQKTWMAIVGAVTGETQRPRQGFGQLAMPAWVSTLAPRNDQGYSSFRPDGGDVANSLGQENKVVVVQQDAQGETMPQAQENVDDRPLVSEYSESIHPTNQGCPQSSDNSDITSSSGEKEKGSNNQSNNLEDTTGTLLTQLLVHKPLPSPHE